MKIVFMGTPQAAVPCLERLLAEGHEVVAVYTQPDRPAGRGKRLTPPPVKEFAVGRGLRVLQPTKIRTVEALDEFRGHAADLAVVVAYGRILPAAYLNAFPNGAINVHFSLLPKYRGAAPVNWAIVNGEAETGVTTMLMDEGLDTGDILLQAKTEIGPDENSAELMERLASLGADLLSKTLDRLDEIEPSKQDDSLATLAPLMTKQDGRIEWSETAARIAGRIRGFQPFPTAYTFLEGRKFTIWSAVANGSATTTEPGTVISAKGDRIDIACGGGSVLAVSEVQIEGKRRMPVQDFLNGVRLSPGTILG